MKGNKFLWTIAFLSILAGSFFTLGETAFGASNFPEIPDDIWNKQGVSLRTQGGNTRDGPWHDNESFCGRNRNDSTRGIPYIRCAEQHGYNDPLYSCHKVLSSSSTTVGDIEDKTRTHARQCRGWKQRVGYLAQDDTSIDRWLRKNVSMIEHQAPIRERKVNFPVQVNRKTIGAAIFIGLVSCYLGTKIAHQPETTFLATIKQLVEENKQLTKLQVQVGNELATTKTQLEIAQGNLDFCKKQRPGCSDLENELTTTKTKLGTAQENFKNCEKQLNTTQEWLAASQHLVEATQGRPGCCWRVCGWVSAGVGGLLGGTEMAANAVWRVLTGPYDYQAREAARCMPNGAGSVAALVLTLFSMYALYG